MAAFGWPETYRVGGSVRDEMLDRESKDGDYIVRGATLGAIQKKLTLAGAAVSPLKLRDGRQVGWRASTPFGLLEIAMPRHEVTTGPGHRDFKIICDPHTSLEEDARRRDFTINALYKNVHTGKILDPLARVLAIEEDAPWGGIYDLEQRWIRTTHPDSFRDDPLRTLRALRFLSALPGEFDFVESTYQEMVTHAESVTALTLKGVSATALSELERILMGDNVAKALRYMRDSGVLQVLLPELTSMLRFEQQSAYHDKLLDEHVFDAIDAAAHLDAPLRVRMSLLFHDAGKPWMAWKDADGAKHYYALSARMAHTVDGPPTAVYSHEWWGAWLAGQALERLNAPAQLRRDVKTLIERHMLPLEKKVRSIKVHTWRAELGDALLADLITHRECDVLGKGNDVHDALEALEGIRRTQQLAISQAVPRCVKDLAIDGADLQRIGLGGRLIGEIQRALLHEVMSQPKLNESEWLMVRAAKLAKANT